MVRAIIVGNKAGFFVDHFKTVKGGALTGTNISLPSRSIRWAMLINLIVGPSISERVRYLDKKCFLL